jgi:type IV secretion system protein TrbL
MPNLSSLIAAMLTFLSTSVSNPALGLLFAIVGGVSMWALQALYYLRDVLLYIGLYGMPIAIALAFGNLPTISDIAMGFCKRFVPLALLPLPAVVVFTGYDLLYGEGILSPTTPFFGQLVAASLLFVAFFVTWKTFQFATPLTAKVLRTTAVGTATVGAVVTGAYIGGAGVGMTAARWGPKAAAGHAIVQGTASKSERSEHGETSPSYRRTENDPDHN